jgi:hypothetical protein
VKWDGFCIYSRSIVMVLAMMVVVVVGVCGRERTQLRGSRQPECITFSINSSHVGMVSVQCICVGAADGGVHNAT